MINARIVGAGRYLPDNIVSNDDLTKFMDTSDEWIVSRTGIQGRRISEGEDTSELATKAAFKALDKAKIKSEDVDLIIVATITPDMYTPSTACIVQKNIKAHKATAFDVSAACTGFLYALSVANAMVKTGQHKIALVIGAEVLSKVMNWKDRSTAVLFGDGAGAVIIKAEEGNCGIKSIYTMSEGDKGNSLEVGAVDVVNPFVKEQLEKKYPYITMQGGEVFKFATRAMIDALNKVLKDAGEQLENIKYVVPHQANLRIISYAAKKLNINIDKFYINLNKYGNTSGASIPIALAEVSEKLEPGDKIILVGFGGGLTYGAALIEW
ncbi:beta-ketoacyl-ACP synthase III [Inconstantimicrobium mannanitabidum]|uniref:3-oxoacyl-[acyl-carrier-protein] synthase 3 n=1 Tax=Inconstantimicrobium mannanitabidum TaxID=1604901 RepID=A0ACB5R8Q7_9CLOT|nr:beta-ketoacyl-ACP synthase III [Clostridium sp. TW13]GKX65398.1 3-oxoacyl-[acyl-carrier-protein] synthase 3 [Clostridium sp. TW13]